ncbi:Phage integrase, N-terminal SAM-like domain [Nitrosomonas halophila]|uniref:Phage integrase, N-terminal SAM-like domain n=2 Tax=Nitrosomonas halophila TaxID=44576 RepID=A0A1H3H3C7_9PROT|nr:Phage integrase, N-terminal SAM-like domain [Nitrosomonas halophila]
MNIMNKPRLLDQVRDKLRLKHYSYRTEQSYIAWIKRFIYFHEKRHPNTMEEREIESFLTHLAVKRNVVASTQNQALCALLFLYKEVLGCELAWLDSMQRAKRPARLPVVLTVQEVLNLLK